MNTLNIKGYWTHAIFGLFSVLKVTLFPPRNWMLNLLLSLSICLIYSQYTLLVFSLHVFWPDHLRTYSCQLNSDFSPHLVIYCAELSKSHFVLVTVKLNFFLIYLVLFNVQNTCSKPLRLETSNTRCLLK